MNTLRAYLQNPVVLRDLGWEYYPPFLGRYPRRKAQILILTTLFFVVLVSCIYVQYRVGDQTGPLCLLIFAALGFLAMIPRSIISGIRAWHRERDFKIVDELILTGMTAEEFAAAKVFARGFAFIAGGLVLAGFALLAVFWAAALDRMGTLRSRVTFSELFNVATVILILPAMLTNIYLRMLRIGLRQGFFLHRAFFSVLWWIVLVPGFFWLFYLLVGVFADRMDVDHQAILIAHYAFLLVAFWFLARATYCDLVSEIRIRYLGPAE